MIDDFAGPYKVSFFDLESSGQLIRIFYPTTIPKTDKSSSQWFPKSKTYFYASGFMDYLEMKWLSPVFASIAYFLKTPVAINQPMQKGKLFPVSVFSHGLSGNRTAYTATCGNLASFGAIVAAPEHGDQSAAITARDNYKNVIRLKKTPDDKSLRFDFRRGQVETRCDEVLATVDVLRQLNDGVEIENKLPNCLKSKISMIDFKGTMDFEQLFLVGHSFGAATAITVLQHEKNPFKCAAIHDPWMFPTIRNQINVPLFSLQSEIFHRKANLAQIKVQFDEDLTKPSIFAVLKGIRHQSFSDFPLLLPAKLVGGGIDDRNNFKIISKCTIEFLSETISFEHYQKTEGGYFGHNVKGVSEKHDMLLIGEAAFEFLNQEISMNVSKPEENSG